MIDPSRSEQRPDGVHRETTEPEPIAEGARNKPLTEYFIEQYKLLVELVRFEHTRWTDNYRIFLTLSVVILAGEGAILGARTWPSVMLFVFLLLLAVLGAATAWCGIQFVTRPERSVNFWYFMLRDFESVGGDLLVPMFTRGHEILRATRDSRAESGSDVGIPGHFSPAIRYGPDQDKRGKLTGLAVWICRAFIAVQLGLVISSSVYWVYGRRTEADHSTQQMLDVGSAQPAPVRGVNDSTETRGGLQQGK